MNERHRRGRESIKYFFKLGSLGFGGPLALLAQMQKDLIEGREWIPRKEFDEVLPLIKTLPGPVAFQTVVFLSREYVNSAYALASGIVFILPSFLMMILLAQYDHVLQSLPFVPAAFEGFQIGALILILFAFKNLTFSYWKKNAFWFFLMLGLLLLGVFHWNEGLVILILGFCSVYSFKTSKFYSSFLDFFLVCFQSGAFSFGTGLTIVPLLENQVVQKLQLLSQTEFLNALALGQLTPGPVIISVVYIGFKSFGWWGAVASAVGVFGPGYINITTWFPKAKKWLASRHWYADFLVGALAALSAGILLSVFSLGKKFSSTEILFGCGMAFLFERFKWPGWIIILVSGILVAIGKTYFFMYSL